MAVTAVIGLGNVLAGDDGFGPYVVRLLAARYHAGPDVEIEDLGTPGLDLAPHIEGRSALIVVDTVSSEGDPGSIRLYRKADLLARAAPARTSPHQPGVKETLLRLDVDGAGPSQVLLVGVVPERVETGVGITAAVKSAAGAAIDAVVEELRRLGHPVEERDPPGDPDLWWE